VKSLVPFPQVLAMLSGKLDWMQQLGYAFATQQADVMDSVQRLRQQAQAAGYLKTTDQQRVVVENSAIVIEPVVPTTVYVPVYSPTIVYGTWAYPAYPPVYIPPPPGYVVGSAFLTGMAFATGVAVVGSLWGWARPGWGGHSVNVNVNTYNNINVNRPPIHSPVWRPPAGGVGGRPIHPPGGPVGVPGRPGTLPAGGGGRPHPHRGPGAAGGHHPGGAHHPGTTPPRPGRTPGATTHGTHAGQPAHHGAPTHGTQPRTPARPHNAGGGAAKAAGPSHGGGHSTKPVK